MEKMRNKEILSPLLFNEQSFYIVEWDKWYGTKRGEKKNVEMQRRENVKPRRMFKHHFALVRRLYIIGALAYPLEIQ